MKAFPGILAVLVLAGWTGPARGDAKDDLDRAIQKLADSQNFSWVAITIEESTAKRPEEAETFEGKWARSGWRMVSKPDSKAFEDAWMKDDRIAFFTPEGWKAIDLDAVEPGKKPDKSVRLAREFNQVKDPLVQARVLAGRGQSLVRHENGLISGQVPAMDAALVLEHALTTGTRVPEGASFRVNFRIRDGFLSSFELVVTYRSFRGKDRVEVENTLAMAVDISDVGTTSIEVPEEARKALQ